MSSLTGKPYGLRGKIKENLLKFRKKQECNKKRAGKANVLGDQQENSPPR